MAVTMQLADELLHFSEWPLEFGRIDNAKQSAEPMAKPTGLWLSVGAAWAEWCLEENFGTRRLACINRVTLAADANILRLASALDLDRFTKEHAEDADDAPHRYRSILWQPVAARYDGILIAPYIWSRRLSLMWYYGWDVASACIWNSRAIAAVETVDLNARELVDAAPSTGGRDNAKRVSRPPRHYNPEPRFGLRVEFDFDAREMDDCEMDDYGDGWCVDCGDPFHLDDIGGYNPPCACGFHCRSCHEAYESEDVYDDDDDEDDYAAPHLEGTR